MRFLAVLLLGLFPTFTYAIIDGEIITDSVFRQSVALVYKSDEIKSQGEIYCSGTLIGPRLVISVAHCFIEGAKAFKVSLEDFKRQTAIYIGETHKAFDLPMINPQLKVSKVIIHPQSDSIYTDLALIELSEDVDLKKWEISPAKGLILTKDFVGKKLIHVGYGQITNKGIKGNKALMVLPLQQLTGWNGLGVGEMFVKGPSACHGDSGGSAYMHGPNGDLSFVGIEYGVSNHPCGESATYFLPLSERILNWIKEYNFLLF